MSELIFDRFVLDVDRRLLLCEGRPVDAQPLVFDLLTVLARRPRRVVSKAELLAAVWRSSSVTDSVVARAVMKARRALCDDAQEPTLLRTVQRVGYVLEADVQERASMAARLFQAIQDESRQRRLALLPIKNLTDLTALSWVDLGLMRLLHQWLEGTGTVSLVPPPEVLEASQGLNERDDLMSRVCDSTGATEAARCELVWSDITFTMRCWLGSSAPGRLVFEASAPDLIDLTHRLANSLVGQARLGTPMDADAFWQEQIASVVHLQQSGQPTQALALLDRSLPQVGSNLQLDLLKARLLCQCDRFHEMLQHVDVLLSRAETTVPILVRIELLDMRGECLHQLNRLNEAMESFQQALGLSRQEPQSYPMRPDILGRAARLAARQLNASVAIGLAELATEEAGRQRQPAMQLRAALWLCSVLLQLDQWHRAQSAVIKAIELGQRSGIAEYEARAWRYLSVLQNTSRQNHAAHESIKRSIALCLRCGNEYELVWGRAMELIVCLEAGWFEDAKRIRSQIAARPDMPQTQRAFVELADAALDWRMGNDNVALERMRSLTRNWQGPVDNTTMNANAELVMMYIHAGQLQEAQASLTAIEDCALPGYVERRQAALALARGDRRNAIRILREAWRSGKIQGGEGFLITVDLTWLLLESVPTRFDEPELEGMFAHVLDLSDESTEVQLLKAAYLLRQQPNVHSRAEWDRVVAQATVLQRRCPMMLTRSYREAMAVRTPPHLGELLSRVCW